MRLERAGLADLEQLWQMQTSAFAELLAKYRDFATSPGNESRERIAAKLSQRETFFYFIVEDGVRVGAIRVVDRKDGSRKKVAPVFILPEFRRRGLAQSAFREIERIHGSSGWKLDTILQEEGNCALYEKLGYVRTGQTQKISEKMDIVFYEKD